MKLEIDNGNTNVGGSFEVEHGSDEVVRNVCEAEAREFQDVSSTDVGQRQQWGDAEPRGKGGPSNVVDYGSARRKLFRYLFLGKILGLHRDYFIVQGVNETGGAPQGCFPTRRTLYSRDCVRWGLLTPATEEMIEKASIIRGRFSGDPSHKFELPISSSKNEERTEEEDLYSETALETDRPITLKEEDRLAAVVASIDQDAMIVPRGAFVRSSVGKIYRNRMFEGLSLQEATKLQYYFLFRKPIGLTRKTLLQRANLDSAIDFMDNIEEDLPTGRWSLQVERGGNVVILRNLEWLGYTFYHIPGTKEFGSAYFGTGERNIDMPFML